MQDNRWLYFIVGGLLVVALVYFGLVYERDGAPSGGSTQVQTTTQPSGAGSRPSDAGSAAGSSSGGGSSTSVTVEQKKE